LPVKTGEALFVQPHFSVIGKKSVVENVLHQQWENNT
jgi:hypothetical protein